MHKTQTYYFLISLLQAYYKISYNHECIEKQKVNKFVIHWLNTKRISNHSFAKDEINNSHSSKTHLASSMLLCIRLCSTYKASQLPFTKQVFKFHRLFRMEVSHADMVKRPRYFLYDTRKLRHIVLGSLLVPKLISSKTFYYKQATTVVRISIELYLLCHICLSHVQ